MTEELFQVLLAHRPRFLGPQVGSETLKALNIALLGPVRAVAETERLDDCTLDRLPGRLIICLRLFRRFELWSVLK